MNTTTEINGRKILFENEMTRSVGMFASCNNCERIIFEDEMTAEQYTEGHGYCPECSNEIEPLPEPHDIETTPIMDTDEIFNLVSNVLWGDLSEAIASTYATPREVFSHMTAMEEITQAITDQILGKHCKVWIDSENHALGQIEVVNN